MTGSGRRPEARAGTTLEQEYGGPLPPGLARLDPEQQDRLCAAIDEARTRQREELGAAIERGLEVIPRLLRPAVKKALFG